MMVREEARSTVQRSSNHIRITMIPTDSFPTLFAVLLPFDGDGIDTSRLYCTMTSVPRHVMYHLQFRFHERRSITMDHTCNL